MTSSKETSMSTLKTISLNLALGQTILVGKNRTPAEITKIEYHKGSGEVSLGTTQGPRKALTFALPVTEFADDFANVADRYR